MLLIVILGCIMESIPARHAGDRGSDPRWEASFNVFFSYCQRPLKSKNYFSLAQLAFLTPCDQAFNPPFLGGKIIELAKFCFKNKRFEPTLSFFSKPVIASHCL